MSFIEVKNVKFRYPQTKKDALGGIELSIERASTYRSSGITGAAKARSRGS